MSTIFWFRRDLRLEDNAGLYHALKKGNPVQCIFIFDENILNKLSDKSDARVSFIYQALVEINSKLKTYNSTLHIYHGKPLDVWQDIVSKEDVEAVYTNRDYESYAVERDGQVQALLGQNNISFHAFKDHVIFEAMEILKKDNTPYTVFTPYKKKWLAKVEERKKRGASFFYKSYPTLKYAKSLSKDSKAEQWCTLEDIGFATTEIPTTIQGRKAKAHQGIWRQA